MTDPNNVKALAQNSFRAGLYSDAFSTLWELGPVEFIKFAVKVNKVNSKRNWLTDKNSAEFFWDEFALQPENYDVLFSEELSENLLHQLFTISEFKALRLIEKLASSKPQILINAIRQNQVFLAPDYKVILSNITSSPGLELHKKAWNFIFHEEQKLWNEIKASLEPVLRLESDQLLSILVIWIETKRFQNPNKETEIHLASVYNFFIELVYKAESSPLKFENWKLDESAFFIVFGKEFGRLSKTKGLDKEPVAILLNRISLWIQFKESIIDSYSYDFDFEIVSENGTIFLKSDPVSHYRWSVDGVRYGIIQQYYHFISSETVEYQITTQNRKIPGDPKTDHGKHNLLLAEMIQASVDLLSDLGITQFEIGPIAIPSQALVAPILGFSFNKLIRYEGPIKKMRVKTDDWFNAYSSLVLEMAISRINLTPAISLSKDDFKKLTSKNVHPELPCDLPTHYLESFGNSFDLRKPFNRFSPTYNVWEKPFLELGEGVFCPASFFGTNSWFYAMAQHGLRERLKKITQPQTEKMEEYLEKVFTQPVWNVHRPQEGSQEGDVDLIIEDENACLLIQIKRPYFRLNLKDQFNEDKIIDSHGADQLNQFEKAFDSKGKAIFKWIVSSSFEGTNQKIKGCLKVNYFELLFLFKSRRFKTIAELENAIKREQFLNDCLSLISNPKLPQSEKKILEGFGLPIPIFDQSDYTFTLTCENPALFREYASYYNKGLDFQASGESVKAIECFTFCLSKNKGDSEVWGAMGNSYCDLRKFSESLEAFENALKINPIDPLLNYNYSNAIWESGKYDKALSVLMDIYQMFPLMKDIKNEIEVNFKDISRKGLLPPDELQKLYGKWEIIKNKQS